MILEGKQMIVFTTAPTYWLPRESFQAVVQGRGTCLDLGGGEVTLHWRIRKRGRPRCPQFVDKNTGEKGASPRENSGDLQKGEFWLTTDLCVYGRKLPEFGERPDRGSICLFLSTAFTAPPKFWNVVFFFPFFSHNFLYFLSVFLFCLLLKSVFLISTNFCIFHIPFVIDFWFLSIVVKKDTLCDLIF